MLMNRFHHPRLHDAARMWTMYVYVLSRLFILEANTGTGCCSFIMLGVTEAVEQGQTFFKGKVFG